ncbi:CPSF30 [Symbiodinium sp. CCMP2592]|nr:CPSF30 [Symbiodinium sp. CCMP2592]
MLGPVGHVSTDVFEGFGRSFEVRWLRLDDLDFSEVSDIVNPWNENRSVKVSRDGQELPHAVGRQVCELVDHRVFTAEPSGYIDDSQEVETGATPLESVPAPAPAPICPNTSSHPGGQNGPAAHNHPGSLAPYPFAHAAVPAVHQIAGPPVLPASPSWVMGGSRAFATPFSSHPHHAWWPPPGSFQAAATEPSLSSSSESARRHRRSRKERDHNSLTGGRKRRRREVINSTTAEPGEPAGQRTEQVRSPTVPPSGWAGAAPTAPTTSRSVMPPSAWLGASPNEGSSLTKRQGDRDSQYGRALPRQEVILDMNSATESGGHDVESESKKSSASFCIHDHLLLESCRKNPESFRWFS